MTPLLLDEQGEPVTVRGYAAVFGCLSYPRAEHDGRPLMIAPGAFDQALAQGNVIACNQRHQAGTILGSTIDVLAPLRVWSDETGLAFELGPLPATMRNQAALHMSPRGCSIHWAGGLSGEGTLEDGRQVQVVAKVNTLLHITLTDDPGVPAAGWWLSGDDPTALPHHLAMLQRLWQPRAAAPRPARSARPLARVRRPGASQIVIAPQDAAELQRGDRLERQWRREQMARRDGKARG